MTAWLEGAPQIVHTAILGVVLALLVFEALCSWALAPHPALSDEAAVPGPPMPKRSPDESELSDAGLRTAVTSMLVKLIARVLPGRRCPPSGERIALVCLGLGAGVVVLALSMWCVIANQTGALGTFGFASEFGFTEIGATNFYVLTGAAAMMLGVGVLRRYLGT